MDSIAFYAYFVVVFFKIVAFWSSIFSLMKQNFTVFAKQVAFYAVSIMQSSKFLLIFQIDLRYKIPNESYKIHIFFQCYFLVLFQRFPTKIIWFVSTIVRNSCFLSPEFWWQNVIDDYNVLITYKIFSVFVDFVDPLLLPFFIFKAKKNWWPWLSILDHWSLILEKTYLHHPINSIEQSFELWMWMIKDHPGSASTNMDFKWNFFWMVTILDWHRIWMKSSWFSINFCLFITNTFEFHASFKYWSSKPIWNKKNHPHKLRLWTIESQLGAVQIRTLNINLNFRFNSR